MGWLLKVAGINEEKVVQAIYDSLTDEQKLFVAPSGKFIAKSPYLKHRVMAEDDAGFADLYMLPGSDRQAFLTMAVSPQHQGQGIGSFLLDSVIQKAKDDADIDSIVYRAAAANKPSLRMGSKAGKLRSRTDKDVEFEIGTKEKPINPRTRKLVNKVLQAYRDQYGVDMGDMTFIEDDVAHFNDGRPVPAELGIPAGGSWTKKKKVYLTHDFKSTMDAYGVSEDENSFAARLIAHELAHEIYNNRSSKKFRKAIIDAAKAEEFTTPYLKTVDPDKYKEEAFAEYLADQLVSKMISRGCQQRSS